MIIRKAAKFSTLMLTVLSASILHASTAMDLNKIQGKSIDFKSDSLYPEGVDYSESRGEFVVGSIRKGLVIALSEDGISKVIVNDNRLKQVVGVRVDEERQRILVNSSDYGVGEKSGGDDSKFSHVAFGIYDLKTGKPIHYVDLSGLRQNEKKFANDLDIDSEGNAYITDSLSASIYKVTPEGVASLFLTNEDFRGEGFNLNGIQYHDNGYLLVAKKSDGKLFKVPVNEPEKFSEVKLPKALIGTDGLLLHKGNNLIAITNRASGVVSNTVYKLESNDDWASAKIVDDLKIDDVYPTTGAVAKGTVYVNFGYLHTLGSIIKEGKPFRQSFRLQAISEIK